MDIDVRERPSRELTAPAAPRRADKLVQIDILEDMKAAEPVWRRLETAGALASPYQRFGLL
jgi:CelD/BcsL family acetyltransferase involved in cellulose biosynthesis